jgi:methionine sulfoxide reductase catalytic subunit
MEYIGSICGNWRRNMQTEDLLKEITQEKLYFSRRKFLALVGTVGLSAALVACGITPSPEEVSTAAATLQPDPLTPYDTVINYNNFYEFSLNKDDVAEKAANFQTSPWIVEVSGLVDKPAKFSVTDLIKTYPAEERIYRMRCVEGWSMVIPWNGFPLHKLLTDVGVQKSAKFVKFSAPLDPQVFPGQSETFFSWPYTEGLRLDEANHDLTILATGLYSKPLPPQEGAPIRLVVPWKYGFKSIKSINKIELVSEQPATFWNTSAPNEYGFYSNVNPNVPHPRWSQSTERRIGELKRRGTAMFNGYGDQVANLYTGMDLEVNF